MDSYAIHTFYNNHRKPLTLTSLHDRNLPKRVYEDVMYIRTFMCKEIINDGKHDYFKSGGHDKENKKM
jgi:hypothetical protein